MPQGPETPQPSPAAGGEAGLPNPSARLTAFVRGGVQGVGFRWWVRGLALELGLVGHAANLSDGRVEVVVEGPRGACASLLTALGEQPSAKARPGRVAGVGHHWAEPRGIGLGFTER
jgi:acylphosphatase